MRNNKTIVQPSEDKIYDYSTFAYRNEDRKTFLNDRNFTEYGNKKYNQYDNLSNRQAHYEQTAPEIWEQTEGKLTHFVAGAGTGGTVTGCGMFFKERNPNIKIVGVDTYGSILKEFHETGELHYDHRDHRHEPRKHGCCRDGR